MTRTKSRMLVITHTYNRNTGHMQNIKHDMLTPPHLQLRCHALLARLQALAHHADRVTHLADFCFSHLQLRLKFTYKSTAHSMAALAPQPAHQVDDVAMYSSCLCPLQLQVHLQTHADSTTQG